MTDTTDWKAAAEARHRVILALAVEQGRLEARMDAAELVVFAYDDRAHAKTKAQRDKAWQDIERTRKAWGDARAAHDHPEVMGLSKKEVETVRGEAQATGDNVPIHSVPANPYEPGDPRHPLWSAHFCRVVAGRMLAP